MPTDEVTVFPALTKKEAKIVNDLIEEKGHLEYLALMLLRDLDERVDLKGMLKRAVRREECDESVVDCYCGQDPDADDYGCSSAEGYTIETLLEAWRNTTDKMLSAIAAAGRRP